MAAQTEQSAGITVMTEQDEQIVEQIEQRAEGASFLKTCFNGFNALSGVGLITIPYTLSRAGWFSLALLLFIAAIMCYTGLLLKWCMDSNPAIRSYLDIADRTFGHIGRTFILAFMYSELFFVSTSCLILEGDNLHSLFPNIREQVFTSLAALLILPSMWLKDLSWLSFISACGAGSSLIIISSIFWVGAVDGVGFHSSGCKTFDLSGIPTAVSLYAFCYGGHPVFPAMYSSMKDKSKFFKVLLISFGLVTCSYISIGILGYMMFGHSVLSQVTLNLPPNKISSKIAIYTTLVRPIAKYAITMLPIVQHIESLLPNRYSIWPIYLLLRTLLVGISLAVALIFPFFGMLVALIGAVLNVTISILFPCACYLKISEGHRRWRGEAWFIMGIMVMAVSIGVMGTYAALKEIRSNEAS